MVPEFLHLKRYKDLKSQCVGAHKLKFLFYYQQIHTNIQRLGADGE